MDIELLSRMVKELVLDNDIVTLPGVGAFVVESVPSTFSDKGYTVNPPYRRLVFRQREEADGLLAAMYARANDVDTAAAEVILGQFLEQLKADLESRKTVVFPGLGRLRATKQNSFFFVADEELDIDPEGFGLKPVSLKTHVETDDEVAEAVASLRNILDVPEPQPVAVPVAEPAPAPVPQPVVEPVPAEEPQPEPAVASEPVAEPVAEPQQEAVTEPVPEPAVASEPVAEPAPEPTPEPEPAPQPEPEPAAQPAPVQPKLQAQPAPRPKLKKRTRRKLRLGKAGKAIIVILLSLVLLAVVYMLLGRAGLLDSILYTEDELQILNHQFTILR